MVNGAERLPLGGRAATVVSGEAAMRKVIRVLALMPLALIDAGCDNQAAVADLRTRTEALTAEVTNLKGRVEELEALTVEQGKAMAAKATSPPSPDTAMINRVLAECVRKVRSLETQPKGLGQPYAEFDAFYNPGSGRVENNNRYADQGPTYAFNKCMASKGVPLT